MLLERETIFNIDLGQLKNVIQSPRVLHEQYFNNWKNVLLSFYVFSSEQLISSLLCDLITALSPHLRTGELSVSITRQQIAAEINHYSSIDLKPILIRNVNTFEIYCIGCSTYE